MRKPSNRRMVTLLGDLTGERPKNEDCATGKPIFQSDWRQGFNWRARQCYFCRRRCPESANTSPSRGSFAFLIAVRPGRVQAAAASAALRYRRLTNNPPFGQARTAPARPKEGAHVRTVTSHEVQSRPSITRNGVQLCVESAG